MTKEIVGLIPVKGSSERVQMKNLRKFGDTSLYELKLDQISKVTGFEKVIVSSESDKVLSIAKEKGFNIHERDPKYSTNDIPMSEVYSNVASEIEGEHIAWINVTNPLAGPECYENAILTYNNMDNKYDCMLSVSEVKDYLFYEGRPINFKTYPWQKSQDLVGVVEMNFVINICKRKDMQSWGSCVGNSPFFYHLNRIDSWDVDFQEDFDFCEMVHKSRKY